MFDLNASTLRFWEKEFDTLKPTKNKKGNRIFTKKDIEYIAMIVDLVKHKGFTINGAKEQLKNGTASKQKGDKHSEVIEKLLAIKSKLIALRDEDVQE